MGIATKEPGPIVVPVTLHHQRVSVPAAYRISHPARVGIVLQGAAIRVDHAVSEIIVQYHDHRGTLEESLHTATRDVVRTVRQTLVMWVVDAEVLRALLKQNLGPRLNVGGLEVPWFSER